MTTSPADIKALTQKVNSELQPITAKFQDRVPLSDIESVLTQNGLDPKHVQNGFQHNDEGRLHVEIGEGIYLTMTWYKFGTGRYEVVAYATSLHDDHQTPAKPMDASEKRKAVNKANNDLSAIGKKYWKGIGSACQAVSDALETVGFEAHDFNQKALHNIAGRKEGTIHAAVGNGIYLSFSFYKMEGTGNYEIVTYLS